MPEAPDGQTKEFKFPAIFDSSDRYAAKWQSRFLRCQKIQLASLITAALGGATSWAFSSIKLSALVTIIALLVAVYVRIYLVQHQPERRWYNGRAAAESIKTLAWKYTQCAVPFGKSLNAHEVDRLFLARIEDVIATVPNLDEPVLASNTKQITDSMRTLRSESLNSRKAYYIKLRVDDQVAWYSGKAAFNATRSSMWSIAVIILETCAIMLAIFRFTGSIEFDATGILAAAASGALVWLQSRQHETLAQSYAVTSQELASVSSVLNETTTESDWATKVEQAEEAISREHTLWRASHR
jgi:hypothetical protein